MKGICLLWVMPRDFPSSLHLSGPRFLIYIIRQFDQWLLMLPSISSVPWLPGLKHAVAFAWRHKSSTPYFQSEAREEEEWGPEIRSTPQKFNLEEWVPSFVLRLRFPTSSPLLCSSLWTGIFHIQFSPSPAPSYALIYCSNSGLEQAKERFMERENGFP